MVSRPHTHSQSMKFAQTPLIGPSSCWLRLHTHTHTHTHIHMKRRAFCLPGVCRAHAPVASALVLCVCVCAWARTLALMCTMWLCTRATFTSVVVRWSRRKSKSSPYVTHSAVRHAHARLCACGSIAHQVFEACRGGVEVFFSRAKASSKGYSNMTFAFVDQSRINGSSQSTGASIASKHTDRERKELRQHAGRVAVWRAVDRLPPPPLLTPSQRQTVSVGGTLASA